MTHQSTNGIRQLVPIFETDKRKLKMGILRLANGIEIDVSGGLRILELEDRFLVVGQEMAIRVNSRQEGWEEIRKIKENEC